MSPAWRLTLFGQVGLLGDSAAYTDFETKRAAKLLVLLGLSRTGTMRRDDLADLLWPDDFLDSTRLRLRQELSRLRRGLGDAADLIQSTADTVTMDRSLVETDLDRLARPDRLSLEELARMLAEPFLPGWDDAWALAEKTRADGLRVQAAIRLATKRLDEADPRQALAIAQAAIPLDATCEELRLVAMKAHAALGSLSDALVEYRRYKRQSSEVGGSTATEEPEAMAAALQMAEITTVSDVRPSVLPPLPHPIDRFFGREEALASLRTYLSQPDVRLISLVGPGGIGKTRLATEALKESPITVGFVSFVECNGSADPVAFLFERLLPGQSATEPMASIRRVLQGRPCLLVLDNLEHLDDPGQFVASLLQAIPDVRLVVTSRRPMKLAAEAVITLGPLRKSTEALPLLQEMLGARRGRDADLSEIVDLCDGLPLTLRLAAARLRLLEPGELVQELRSRTGTLRANLPDLPERHRDVERMLEVAMDSLDEADQQALLQISRFPGGVTRSLAQSLGMADVDEVLERLLDSALIWLDDETSPLRFRMLEPVRQYVAARATAEIRADADAGFVEVMSKAAAAFREGWDMSPDTDRRVYLRELANFRTALDLALETNHPRAFDLFRLLWHHELSANRRTNLLKAIDRLRRWPDATPAQQGHAVLCEAWCRSSEGRLDDAAALALEAKGLFEEGNEPAYACYALAAHYEHLRYKSSWEDVARRYEETVALAQRVAPNLDATIRMWRGMVHSYRGEWDEAEADLEFAYHAAEAVENLGTRIMSGTSLLTVDFGRRRLLRLKERLNVLRPLLKELDDAHYWSIFLRAEARLALAEGDVKAAEAHARQGLKVFAFAGNLLHEVEIKVSLARALIRQERLAEATMVVSEMAPAVEAKLTRVAVVATACLAELRYRQGRTEDAAEALAAALGYRDAKSANIPVMEAEYLDEVSRLVGQVAPSTADDARITELLQTA